MADYTTYTDQDLLQQAATGNERAFRVIYDRYKKSVYALALHILRSDLLAEEILQTTLLKVWQMGEQLTTVQNLEAVIRTYTRNACIDELRRQRREQQANADFTGHWNEASDATEELIQFNETNRIVQDAIAALPAYHQKAYVLCHQEGLTYEEAAAQLQLSPHTVQSYIKLALRFLRKYIREHTDVTLVILFFKIIFIFYLP